MTTTSTVNDVRPRRRPIVPFLSLISLLQTPSSINAFTTSPHYQSFLLHKQSSSQQHHQRNVITLQSKNDDTPNEKTQIDPLTKASWYVVEAFGNVFGKNDNDKSLSKPITGDIDFSQTPSNLNEAQKRIELDNERNYFLSGNVDIEAYDENCVFSDPFVSFVGRQRFVDNLANLGSFITDYDARMLNYDVEEDGTVVQTKIMVKLELNLPWKPILAWPWGVRYTIDPNTYLIVDHKETWDIAPWEGVKQIFRPATVTIRKNDS